MACFRHPDRRRLHCARKERSHCRDSKRYSNSSPLSRAIFATIRFPHSPQPSQLGLLSTGQRRPKPLPQPESDPWFSSRPLLVLGLGRSRHLTALRIPIRPRKETAGPATSRYSYTGLANSTAGSVVRVRTSSMHAGAKFHGGGNLGNSIHRYTRQPVLYRRELVVIKKWSRA